MNISKIHLIPIKNHLKRSKSLTSINQRTCKYDFGLMNTQSVGLNGDCCGRSDSSVEVFLANDSESEGSLECGRVVDDSGIDQTSLAGQMVTALEEKIEKLNGLFKEQCKLMSAIKEDISHSKMKIEDYEHLQSRLLMEVLQKALLDRSSETSVSDLFEDNSRARSLLDAIEQKQAFSLQREIRAALSNFLQSEELKERVVSATVESLKDVIQEPLHKEVSGVYVPMLQKSHRRLLKQVSQMVEQAFKHLDEHSSSLARPMYKTSRSIYKALENYHNWLRESGSTSKLMNSVQDAVKETLETELTQHRKVLLNMITSPLNVDLDGSWSECELPVDLDCVCVPHSPAQPAAPDSSIIDQLMRSAEINKQIQDGDVNGSFEKALSASDLSLVMVACRAVDPSIVFADPAQLEQSVLLSLVQQLATDMVHETQLKCRYLEEAMICLSAMNLSTRTHLPMVVEEVRKHLNNFLLAYPSHVTSRRIKLIIMAADHLLK